MLLPAFVQDQGKRKLERIVRADHRERFEADAALMKTRLETEVFGGFPRTVPWSTAPLKGSEGTDTRQELFVLYPEPDMPVPCTIVRRKNQDGALPTVILIEPAGMDAALNTRLAHQLLDRGWQLLALDLRATGQTAVSNEKIRDAIDHNSAEWAIWMGRPLIGQWCWDVIRAIDYLTSSDRTDIRQVALIGTGAGALVAICAGAFDERVRSVAANGLLASFVSAHPPEGHRMATFVPFILDVGDVPHVAALLAPRRLLISAPVDAQNRPIDAERIGDAFAPTQDAYQWYSAAKELRIQAAPQDDFILNSLRVG
jgi:alpha-beta hydrolase superfamily lysophospholipase